MKTFVTIIMILAVTSGVVSQTMYVHTKDSVVSHFLISQIDSITFASYLPPPIDSLVAYYPFNGNANDESGNVNDGTVYGALLTTDRFGQTSKSYQFNGTNDWILVPNSPSLDIAGPISVSIWAKATQFDTLAIMLGKDNDLAGGRSWYLGAYSNKLVFSPNAFTLPGGLNGSGVLTGSVWIHVAVVYDLSSIKMFINGNLDTTIPHSGNIPSSTSPLRIGVMSPSSGGHWYFNGSLDDIRVYKRALSDAEIQNLYHEDGW